MRMLHLLGQCSSFYYIMMMKHMHQLEGATLLFCLEHSSHVLHACSAASCNSSNRYRWLRMSDFYALASPKLAPSLTCPAYALPCGGFFAELARLCAFQTTVHVHANGTPAHISLAL